MAFERGGALRGDLRRKDMGEIVGAGLVAHVYEEQSRERPYRDVGWKNVRYEGPPARKPR